MARGDDRSRAVRQAALTITSELSLDAVLQKIVDVARDLGRARYAALGVAQADRKGLSRFIVSGMTDEQIKAIGRWPRGLGLLGELLQNPQPLRVSNIQEHPSSIGFPPRHPGMTSFLGVPIMLKGEILGNFYLTDRLRAKEFSEVDEDIIVSLAAFAAIAIENARLYTETEQLLRHKVGVLERTANQAKFLVELSALLPTGPFSDELPLDVVLHRTTELLGDACAAYLMAPDGSITMHTVVHAVPGRAKAAEELIGETWDTIRDQIFIKGNAGFVADVEAIAEEAFAFGSRQMREHRFSAGIGLPIRSAKQTYGVFLSLASRPLTFSQEDLVFANLVVQRLATALENSELLRQLRDALRKRDEFISIATHELKNPAATIAGYSQLAMRSVQSVPPQMQTILETINRQSMRLARLADELLDVARIGAGRLDLVQERVNLSALLTESIQRFKTQLSPVDAERLKLLVPTTDLWGDWDAMRLEQVVVNLLNNAFKYSPDDGDVEVRVDQIDRVATVSVKDHGIGIPEDQRQLIFEPFYRSATATMARTVGSGLGLYISKEIIERHNGRMWFESEEGKGSTFCFSLPLESE
jgi:signal transduction histidine kinase